LWQLVILGGAINTSARKSRPELSRFITPGVVGIAEVGGWQAELESVFARVAGRFSRVDLRRRMRDYVQGLLAPVGRKNGWQLAEWAGHRDPAGLQHLLNGARWDPDAVRGDVRDYVGERLAPGGVLILTIPPQPATRGAVQPRRWVVEPSFAISPLRRADEALFEGSEAMIKVAPQAQRRCVYERWRDASPFSMIWMSTVRV
jgi:hypothetical protein